jgi:hypothetical protein
VSVFEDSRLFQRVFPAIFVFASVLAVSVVLSSAQAPTTPGKPLPPGPMAAKVKGACTTCHNVSRITEQHLSRPRWSDELDKMEGLGAVIADADRAPMLDYLTANFGPEKGEGKPEPKKSD